MTRIAAALFLLATALAAAPPWPARGRQVGNEAMGIWRRASRHDAWDAGPCWAVAVAVHDAARAEGLPARMLEYDTHGEGRADRHQRAAVQLQDGRWCGFDYWGDIRVQSGCAEQLMTDNRWWDRRVTCCRHPAGYIGDTPAWRVQQFRCELDRMDPVARIAQRAHRELVVQQRGERLWMGDP